MDGLQTTSPFAIKVADALAGDPFTLIDVGCGGGIDPVWREFGSNLRAIGFEPNLAECRRLATGETHEGIRYEPTFVGLPPDHLFLTRKAANSPVVMNFWQRCSAFRSCQIQQEKRKSEGQALNPYYYEGDGMADAADQIYLPDYFAKKNIGDIDFVKIDVDGPDFEVLVSLEGEFSKRNILALGLEVSYFGTENDTNNTFHNTDRFMRQNGFELFGLSVRRYSAAALPGRYSLGIPAQGDFGRPIQGDALYVRDLLSPRYEKERDRYDEEKLLKLACIFSLFNLPDNAAEILVAFQARLKTRVDVEELLEVLARQAQAGRQKVLGYRDYMAAFERDDPMFYPR
ncbi:FkbM family methyltransferase [Roseomonas genomospecies 6]|uniref:Methyltransferase FkbM domain-containing protein n=1 Tax=Roseomonas genomospecies 6 TaxID=214106 RepID=A0A9W7NGE9_9PROT|nr:FkbM family methyltransferase [Roseomonas genomospecies 6]KAA0676207.1 hypothetical protein DS843_28045 [Roseomonas genomospecies 6]